MGVLDGQVAVISSGTSGIGARAAELFVNEGVRVVIAGRRRKRGEQLAAKLVTAASFIRTDVSLEHAVAAMIQHAVNCFGRLDCLLNTAGDPSARSGIADIDIQSFNATMGVHVGGVLLGMKYAAPIMMRQQSGSIINTASVNGSRAGYSNLTGCTAKAAVIHLTKYVAVELVLLRPLCSLRAMRQGSLLLMTYLSMEGSRPAGLNPRRWPISRCFRRSSALRMRPSQPLAARERVDLG